MGGIRIIPQMMARNRSTIFCGFEKKERQPGSAASNRHTISSPKRLVIPNSHRAKGVNQRNPPIRGRQGKFLTSDIRYILWGVYRFNRLERKTSQGK